MDLYEEFDDALAVVTNLTFFMPPVSRQFSYVPQRDLHRHVLKERHAAFFETVIRYLGGLLSAYALSHDPILLARADDLGTALLPVFDTPSGLPSYAVNPVSGKTVSGWTGGNTILSEALSCQLEYKYLAYLTGRTQYYATVEKVMDRVYTANFSHSRGLLPTMFSTKSGEPTARKSRELGPPRNPYRSHA
jgi:mannosyl-oligosaccharide alpha-1,2-mannosidase